MSESMSSFENIPLSEEAVIEVLNSSGIEDPETREILEKYIDQCHTEADAEAAADPENPIASNRANIKADIRIAILYSKTEKYKNQAAESLVDALIAASQNDSTLDLVQEIEMLLSRLGL